MIPPSSARERLFTLLVKYFAMTDASCQMHCLNNLSLLGIVSKYRLDIVFEVSTSLITEGGARSN